MLIVSGIQFREVRLVALYAPSEDNLFTALLLIGLVLLATRGLAWNQVKALLARGWLTH